MSFIVDDDDPYPLSHGHGGSFYRGDGHGIGSGGHGVDGVGNGDGFGDGQNGHQGDGAGDGHHVGWSVEASFPTRSRLCLRYRTREDSRP